MTNKPTMKLLPILFSTPMVQALLADRKTQTRRILKPQPEPEDKRPLYIRHRWPSLAASGTDYNNVTPRYQRGDILWVQETWAAHFMWTGVKPSEITFDEKSCLFYKADEAITGGCEMHQREKSWRTSRFMPYKAARLFLRVTGVRVERLHDITEVDAEREGVYYYGWDDPDQIDYKDYTYKGDDDWGLKTAVGSFSTLWVSINGPGSWEANPWVWVYEFERTEKPKDGPK